LTDEEILTHLVAAKKDHAADPAKSARTYLRPEFQALGAVVKTVNVTFDLGESPPPSPHTSSLSLKQWPKESHRRCYSFCVPGALAIARAFEGTNAKRVASIVDALAAIGQTRRLADGWYAA
jgi:hypothetical protein